MGRLINTVRRVGLYAAVMLMVGAFPVSVPPALADTLDQTATPTTTDSTAAPATTTPPAETTTIPPTTSSNATYDPTTERWNTDQWQYSTQTDNYQPVPQPVAVTEQPAAETTAPLSTSSTPTSAPASDSTATTNATTSTAITNGLQSTATTGNAGVLSNTTGGSATTGNALAQTTQTNIVNSSLSGGVAPATFTSNITGDVVGDIVLYPMILAAMVQAAATPTTNTTITSTNDTAIANNLNLAATSGDATVASNTAAGSATSGDAAAVANIINMINSVIASGSSFMGTINIYGNLTGDILVSPDFIPQLIAANGGTALNATLSDTQAIANNVTLTAASGDASVTGNTSAGSATSGGAATNLVLLNLTGHQVVAKDSLLVFVNVLGTWVGMIVDAAPGSTSAALGDGVTSSTSNGTTQLDSTNNAAITNNLTLAAQSGDATVTHNTTAGDATSGRATASANIANISQTNIGLTGWFGVLFINVFGSWLGSFGVDTPYGNPQAASVVSPAGKGATADSAAPAGGQAIRFIAHQALSSSTFPLPFMPGSSGGDHGAGTGAAGTNNGPHLPISTHPVSTVAAQQVAAPAIVAPQSVPTLPTIVPFGMVMTTLTLAGVALRRLLLTLGGLSLT